MPKVRSKRSGKIYEVFGFTGTLFLLWKDGRWVLDYMIYYEPLGEKE